MNTQDPKVIKKLERDISRAADKEEKDLQQVIKDLNHTEKVEQKAAKLLHKAEVSLEKSEKKEQATLHELNKATNRHDIAVTNLHTAEHEAKLRQKEKVKLHAAVDTKKAGVDSTTKAYEAHKKERDMKLAELHGQHSNAAVQVPQAKPQQLD